MSKEPTFVTLNEAAERLGVHYMTAYRYVRTGRLAASKVGAEWQVDERELERFATGPVHRRGATGTAGAPHAARLEDRLLAGDEAGAWTVIESALAGGLDPEQIHLQLLGPALHSIGTRWSAGEITIAQEHLASAVTLRLIGRLGPRFSRRGRKRGTVLVGAPPGDNHGIPTAMLGDLLRGRGFEVIDLGPNVPAADWAATATTADRLVAVGLCATVPGNDEQIRAALQALREAVDVPLLLGGQATEGPDHALALGASTWTRSALDALEQIESLAANPAA